MTKFYHFLLLMSILLSIPGYNNAQIIIKGRIVTSTGAPVPLAPIVLRSVSNATILAYTLSSDEGRYELNYTGKLDSLTITVSGFNVVSQSKTISAKTQSVDFKLEEKVIQLREFKVKANKIWGAHDTIN